MLFISQGKTNWIFILIVFVVAVFAGGGILFYSYFGIPKEPEEERMLLIEKTEIEVEEWNTYRNEEYGFELKYPSQIEIIEDADYAESKGLLLSLRLRHKDHSFIFGREEIRGLALDVFDLRQKNQWETYGVGSATLNYKLATNTWLVDGEVCIFPPDAEGIDRNIREKFVLKNKELEPKSISRLLRECEEFYSGYYDYPDNLYIFSGSFIMGFGHAYVFLNRNGE